MRIDLLLNKLCLTKTRSIAKNACDKNLVTINGKLAKASSEVHVEDQIGLKLYGFDHSIRILEIPTGNVSKTNATQYYQLLDKTPLPKP
jgi:ribosomal 50S subunit-recycling heat shock protein